MLVRFPTLGFRSLEQRRRNDELLQLVRSTVEGDRSSGRTLVAALTPHVLRNVRRVLGADYPDVDDVTQDALLAVIRALPSYREESSVLQFACRIATKVAIDVWRRRAYRTSRADQLVRSVEVESEIRQRSPEHQALARRCANAIQELLVSLPEYQAEAVALHYIQGLTVKEVAETTDCPVETVRSRIKVGLRAMRQVVLDDPHWDEMLGETDP